LNAIIAQYQECLGQISQEENQDEIRVKIQKLIGMAKNPLEEKWTDPRFSYSWI
jgi:hypothetical protein